MLKQYNFIHKIKSLSFVERMILFGSRARQDNVDRADIDIAIYCPTATDKDWMIIMNIIDNADTLLKIDCVRLDLLMDDSELKRNILKDGIVIHGI